MQQLHLVVQTVLTGMVLVMLVVIYNSGDGAQASIFLQEKDDAQSVNIIPRPSEELNMPRLPVSFPLMRNVGM